MYFYFPKEELKNCPEGFNLLPVVRSKDDPEKFRTELGLTPFHDYERDVVRISDKRFVDKASTMEVTSFLLMHHKDGWLVIDNKTDESTRVGFLPELVNRGEEQRVYTFNFNSIRTGMETGEKSMIVLGYIVTDDKIIFVNRFDFPNMPTFINKHNSFRLVPGKELFSSEFIEENNLDDLSKFVLKSIGEMID